MQGFSGNCPLPFLDESLFNSTGGYLPGRNCAPNPLAQNGEGGRCCIPCPVYDYLYDDDFKQLTDGAAWANVAGFALCTFLLISMIVLPSHVTRRSYLNIILLVGILCLELGFIIPLVKQPDQCYNAITPNDMYTSTPCAVSGAFAVFGGMSLVTWVLVRAVFMHLQICWDVVPGTYLNIGTNIVTWSVTIGLVCAELIYAGVSFRFGGYCHVNTIGSIVTYWAWLLGFGALAFIMQVATLGYCMKVYLQSSMYGGATTASSTSGSFGHSNKPSGSIAPSSRTRNARATARRVRQVLELQWRSLAIVSIAIFVTAFICIVFIVEDGKRQDSAFANTDALIPWIKCMLTKDDNEACLNLTGPLIISEKVVVAALFVLGVTGIEAFLLLCRFEIFRGWVDLFRRPFRRSNSWDISPRELPATRSVYLENRPGKGMVLTPKAVEPDRSHFEAV